VAGSAWTNQLLNLIVLSAAQQGFSGFFVYSPAPGPGNLIGSWAAAAGTDPYGNAYPAGLSVEVGALTGTNLFLYNGPPAAGNLLISAAAAAGVDPHGNNYLQGLATYGPGDANALIGGALIWYTGSEAGGWTFVGQLELSGSSLIADFSDFQVDGTMEVTGNTTFSSSVTVDGVLAIDGGAGSTIEINGGAASITENNFNMASPMGAPPNAAAVAGGTATNAQLQAFCSALYTEMRGRGLFN
jgi:hypothetical protein